ncbi:hypothetical protein TCSYLVIO_001448 [Trypanosoma cruzi]|nr:hypothetical protein TCSYLVIO_001448 [Trypanosoma cruzi]
MVLDWPAAPKTARAGPHRAPPGHESKTRPTPQSCAGHFASTKSSRILGLPKSNELWLLRMPRRIPQNEVRCGALLRSWGRPLWTRARPRSWRDTVALSAFPRTQFDIWEAHHNADPGVVTGRIGAKGDTAEGREPWLRAESVFPWIFIIILTKPQDAQRKRSAPPQEERAIPLQQVNVPVLSLGRNRSRLNPATLGRLMQVWGLVGRLAFPRPSSGKARGSSRRVPATGARLVEATGMVEDASSTKSG